MFLGVIEYTFLEFGYILSETSRKSLAPYTIYWLYKIWQCHVFQTLDNAGFNKRQSVRILPFCICLTFWLSYFQYQDQFQEQCHCFWLLPKIKDLQTNIPLKKFYDTFIKN